MGIVVALAITASLVYGASDFLGAVTARSLTVVKASSVIYLAATVVSVIALPFITWTYSDQAMWAGVIAGALGILGMIMFYAALAIGPISLLTPLIALIQTAIPVFVAAVTGQSLQLLAWIAVGLAIVATTMISFPARTASGEPAVERITPRGGLLALISGVSLGFSVVFLDTSPPDSGVFSGFVDTAVGLILLLPLLAVRRLRNSNTWLEGSPDVPSIDPIPTVTRPGPGTWMLSAVAGALLGVGNILLVIALHSGNLAVVAVLVSLYPLGTVLLARFVLKERIGIAQLFGVLLAIAAVVMLGAS